MSAPLSATAGVRVLLDAGWEIARDPVAGPWRAIGAPRPVPAVLAEAGEWSLDGPARRFDAEAWCYRVRFDAPAAVRAAGGRLGFDGLATCCEVSLNGVVVLRAANMFRAHVVELPASAWRATGNELAIRFDALDAHLAARRPRPRWRAPMVGHQQLRYVRTTLLGRTPGWSPAAAPVGIWRDVWLEPLGEAAPEVIERRAWIDGDGVGRVSLAVRIGGGPALVSAVLRRVASAPAGDPEVTGAPIAAHRATDADASPGPAHDPATDPAHAHPAGDIVWRLERGADGLFRGVGTVPDPAHWWPHTHGEPARYALVLRVLPLNAAAPVRPATARGASTRPARDTRAPFDIRQVVDHPLGHVGLRTLAIDRGADGAGFALRVNDVPVFCRGVCWVPLDTLRLHAAPADYHAMLATLRRAGVNMIRVGGTMVYEDAAFFEACDAAGVMVWQEFMFANMDYPQADAAFAAEVAAEAAQQLALWRAHACVAVVCGNSEVAQQAAMWGADRDAWTPALFHDTLARLVADALPDVPWWPSSAFGGAFPFQPAAGTTSYYGVGAYLRPLADARWSGLRFATECLAFAQVPDDAALARFAALQGGVPVRAHQPLWKERVPRDLGAGWDFDDVRDHYVVDRFGLDAAEVRRGDLSTAWSLARAATAETMAGAFVQWRDPASACGGALTWFLRDLRVGAGWGVVDEQGHPKAALHALARSWRPVHVGLVDDGQNGVAVYVVNESPRALAGALTVTSFQPGGAAVGRVEQALAVPAHGAWRDSTLAHAPGFLDLNGSYRFGPAVAEVVVATWRDAAGALLGEAVCFLDPVRAGTPLARSDIGLDATARPLGDAAGTVRVTLRTRAAARGVHFEARGWRADDEYFALAPGATREVDFTPVRGAVLGTVPGVGRAAPVVPSTPSSSLAPSSPAAPRTPPAWYARVGAINALGWTSAALE